MSHLLLKLQNSIHERLTGRRTSRNVDIYRYDPVTAPNYRVRVMVVTSSVRTRSHRDNPSRVRHLVVNLTERRRHLVGKGSGNDHNIGLTWGGTENDTETILIVTGSGKVHHLNGTAGETEGHRPKGTLAGPVGDLIECGPRSEDRC